ncbi:unnamed protein product, partial [Closterium sp. NIES-53]
AGEGKKRERGRSGRGEEAGGGKRREGGRSGRGEEAGGGKKREGGRSGRGEEAGGGKGRGEEGGKLTGTSGAAAQRIAQQQRLLVQPRRGGSSPARPGELPRRTRYETSHYPRVVSSGARLGELPCHTPRFPA